jgi:hypothetical protein
MRQDSYTNSFFPVINPNKIQTYLTQKEHLITQTTEFKNPCTSSESLGANARKQFNLHFLVNQNSNLRESALGAKTNHELVLPCDFKNPRQAVALANGNGAHLLCNRVLRKLETRGCTYRHCKQTDFMSDRPAIRSAPGLTVR